MISIFIKKTKLFGLFSGMVFNFLQTKESLQGDMFLPPSPQQFLELI